MSQGEPGDGRGLDPASHVVRDAQGGGRLISPLRAVLGYVWRYRAHYLVGAGCLVAGTVLSLAIPWTVKHAIEALQSDASRAPLARDVTVIVLLAIVNGAVRMASRFAIIGAAQRIEADLRNDLYGSLQTFLPGFYATRTIGDLMARASSDVAGVKSLIGFGAVSTIGTGTAFVGAVSAMVFVDPWLTLWAMSPYPVLIVLALRFNRTLHERTDAAQAQLGTVSARVQEYLAGMTVVRAYTMETQAMRSFSDANGELLERNLALARVQAQFTPLMTLIAGLGTLTVLWLGGRDVVAGRLTLGALVAFNGYLAYLAWPTMAFGWTLAMARRGLTSMGRIQEIINLAGPARAPAPAATWQGSSAIRFEHLTFAYDGIPVLRDVSFAVAERETVAVVGPTGSGKTTLGLLVARLWDPPPGTVFVGGHDVTTVDPSTLRAALGYVPQEAFLFSRSIADNVTLVRDGIGRDDARGALATAAVTSEIDAWPHGLDTVVGERGLTLSGGQRQRVALARALAGAPPILILDDLFANVDSATEEAILRGVREATASRTVLLMTHRLRAARAADRVVVLAEGHVVETGTHDALLAQGGLYARLWRIQQLEEEIARAS